MKASLIRSRSRLSRGFEAWALVGLVAISSACSSEGQIQGGGGSAGTGAKGSGGTSGVGGAVGTGGSGAGTGGTVSIGTGGAGGTVGSGGAVGTGGSVGVADSGSTGGGAGNGGAVDAGTTSNDSGSGNQGTPPSCAPGGPGMTDCGAAHESCCVSLEVVGGMYSRTFSNASGTAPTGARDPATVSNFSLDKYLVTVGRYRQFASAWSGGWRPAAGSGKHAYLSGGGLAATAGGIETGWEMSFTASVSPTNASLTGGSFCDSRHATWTAAATGGRENFPINCVNWEEAYAFCIWDGGFLPSEAEWEYAAVGGSEQRKYPWGAADPGTMNQYAIYGSFYTANALNIAPVGTATMGAGRWGQLDLAGEIWEWNLDWKNQPYVSPCTDCVNLTSAQFRIVRGDNFAGTAANLNPTIRGGDIAPEGRDSNFGVRCARAP